MNFRLLIFMMLFSAFQPVALQASDEDGFCYRRAARICKPIADSWGDGSPQHEGCISLEIQRCLNRKK